MKLKEKIIGFVNKLKHSGLRFISVFVWSLLLFCTLSADIIFDINSKLAECLALSTIMGMVFSIVGIVFLEKWGKMKLLYHIISIIPTIVTFFIFYNNDHTNDYLLMYYMGIIIALLAFGIWALFTEDNRKSLIAYLFKSVTFVVSVCIVLTGSIMLCVLAINFLLIEVHENVYPIILLFIWIVFFVNMLMAYIPRRDEELKLPRFFKVMVLYVGMPVYLLLLGILIGYLLKIVLMWNMPVGKINWFASFASLFFAFFIFTISPFENKFVKWFTKWGGFLLLPIIFMQGIAIYERVSAYGLTTPRTISVILVGVSFIFTLLTILRGKKEYIFTVIGVVALIFTLIPKINVIDIPKQSQIAILEECLIKNEMLYGNTVIKRDDISDEDKERIYESYRYLSYKIQPPFPEWLADCKEVNYKDKFGFEVNYSRYNYDDYIHCYYSGEETVDIADYSTMHDFYLSTGPDHNKTKFVLGGQEYEFDFMAFAEELYKEHGENGTIKPIDINENVRFIPETISATLEKQEVTDVTVSGKMLVK